MMIVNMGMRNIVRSNSNITSDFYSMNEVEILM